MVKKLDESMSVLEGEKKVSLARFDKTIEELNINFEQNLNIIKSEGKEKYKILEVEDGFEKPSEDAFINAYVGYKGLNPKNKNYLTIFDFYPNNTQGGLFYIINMQTNKVEYLNKVGHGQGSRGEKDSSSGSPDSYSNELGSKQSSLGFFKTAKNLRPGSLNIREGLKLEGVEKRINDNAAKRAIYIHPAGLDQSEGCFTLPYDKAEGQDGEDEILKQLIKIKGESIVFAYDSRVFEEYKKQSKLFSDHVEHTGNLGLYIVDKEDEDEIRERVAYNKKDDEVPFFQRSMNFIERKFFEGRYEKQRQKDRECWWKKKEIEKIAAQIGKQVEKDVEKKNLQDLYNNVYNVWIRFKEEFYKSKAEHRRENIDIWVSEFWDTIIGLFKEKDLIDLIKMCDDKKSEYKAWEEKSSKNSRKIPGDEYAEKRLAA